MSTRGFAEGDRCPGNPPCQPDTRRPALRGIRPRAKIGAPITSTPCPVLRAHAHRRHRNRIRRPRHGRRPRALGARRPVRRHRRGESRSPEARRNSDLRTRPRAAREGEPGRGAPHVHDRRSLSRAGVGHRLHRGGNAARRGRLGRSSARARRRGDHRARDGEGDDRRDQEHGPGRDRASGAGGDRGRHGSPGPRVLESGVPEGGGGDRGLHEAGPGGDRCGQRARRPRPHRPLRAVRSHRERHPGHGHRVGRDHQVCGQCDARDPDLVHEPRRAPLRGGWGRRGPGAAGESGQTRGSEAPSSSPAWGTAGPASRRT